MSRPDPFPRLQALPPDIAAALTRAAGRLAPVCREVRWYAEVTSTNDVAAALADAGAPEGLVVVADAQTAGRGRQRRVWASPPGAGLYVSVVLKPMAAAAGLLTIAAGVALAEGIERATGLRTALKWPNDVMVPTGTRGQILKLAGILAEASSSPSTHAGAGGPALQACVLGFGVNLSPAAYPADVAARATSLERELGRPVDRGIVLAECLCALASRYDDLRNGRADVVVDAWRVHARPLLGNAVEWDGPGGACRGTAVDIDASGALMVRSDGVTVRVISGDVRWM